MKKGIISLFVVATFISKVNAQDENDALRYGMSNNFGTARSMGIGNAMGSVGGDFSTLSVNPAGIGVYRKSELSFTPDFSSSKNEGTYLGQTSTDQKSKFNLAQIGLVLTNAKKGNNYKRSGWKAASFGFGMNRLANFSNDYSYTGKNYSNSIVDKWVNDFNTLGGLNANTLNSVNYSAYAAYQTYLIDKNYAGDSSQAKSYVPVADGLQQTKRVTETGGMNEIVISAGGNYMEKLMIGATLGITNIKYNRTLQIDEQDLSGKTNNDFNYLRYNEYLSTTGNGINLKLGAIVKVNNNFRLGLALHTPTVIQFNDASKVSITTNTDSLLIRNGISTSPISTYTQDSTLVFNYTMTTPAKAIASATLLFNQFGFVTADIEYVGYQGMKYNFGQGYENESSSMNKTIQNTYKSNINVRVGAEVKLTNVALRAGVAYYGSPYSISSVNADRLQLSLGIGYRAKNWFIDGAFVNSIQKISEKPYVLPTSNAVSNAIIKNTRNQVVVTLGLKL